MPVNNRFGGSLGGTNSTPYTQAFSTQTALGGGAVVLTAAQVVAGYGQSAAGGAVNLTFPSASDLLTASGIPLGQPLSLTYTILNTDAVAGNTYTATGPGGTVTLATGANTPIPGSESGCFVLSFSNTSSTTNAAYTITRIY